MKCKIFPFSYLSTSIKEQLLLQGKALFSLWVSQCIYDVGLIWTAPLYVTRKESLSLFRVGVLTVATGYKSGSQAGLWDLDPLEGILSSRYPLLFSSLLEVTVVEGYSLLSLSCKQLHPGPDIHSFSSPEKWQQAECAWAVAWTLVIPQKVSQKRRGSSYFLPLIMKITLIHWKWIRFDSRTNHIWERQRKRSWGTVLSLKRAQFLSFSENRNNSRLLRTFSRQELEYTPLHYFLIESAWRLQRRGESWLLKVSSCFKSWPPLKRGPST